MHDNIPHLFAFWPNSAVYLCAVQCDQIWRFFCTLGNFLKALATINFPNLPHF